MSKQDIIIKNPEFLGSFDNYKKCPSSKLREYAFIGRSNVGKSSLINMLCQKKGLAKVSGTPGKTRLLNLFNVDNHFILTDLPGFGFARASKADIGKWQKFILDYLINRENLHCLFILIDVRLEPQKIDLEFIDWVGIQGIPFVLVFTKGDKVSKNEQQSSIARFKKAMLKTWDEIPPFFATSSERKEGRAELLKFMLES